MNEQQEKMKFREAIDHTLTGLEGNPFLYQRVAAQVEKGEKKVKSNLTKCIVIALIVVMCMSTVAVAAMVLNYSPSVSALKRAREAVMEKYGLTQTTLGLFNYEMSMTEDAYIIEFRSDVLNEERQEVAGCYTVIVPENGEISVTWSHDDVDPALWQSGDMNASVWGQPQLETFLRDRTNAGTVEYHVIVNEGMTGHATPTPMPVMDEMELVEVRVETIAPAEGDLQENEVRELASAAFADTYDLTEAELAQVDIFRCELTQISGYSTRLWHVNAYLYRDGYDWNLYAVIDAETGEIVDIGMQTGGNG